MSYPDSSLLQDKALALTQDNVSLPSNRLLDLLTRVKLAELKYDATKEFMSNPNEDTKTVMTNAENAWASICDIG